MAKPGAWNGEKPGDNLGASTLSKTIESFPFSFCHIKFLFRWIHDEMYGVNLDLAGNYLLLGGSGDEYTYSATNADGWQSDIWVSYLIVVDPKGNTLFQGVFGDKGGNSAGEYLSVDQQTGEVMIYVDADTIGGGYGFMKVSTTT